MSKSKTVSFTLPEDVYKHLESILHNFIGYPDVDVKYFCRCLLINKCIEKGYLNDFAEPNNIFSSPVLDLSKSELQSFSNITTSYHSKEFADNGEPIC